MTRKMLFSFILISVISCFLFTFCSGGGKYGEVKQLLNEYIATSEKLNKALDSAKDGKTVAKALTEYIKKMKTLNPKVESLPEKYPELGNDPPEELKDLIQKFEASTGVLFKVMNTATKFKDDPEVIKALKELEGLE